MTRTAEHPAPFEKRAGRPFLITVNLDDSRCLGLTWLRRLFCEIVARLDPPTTIDLNLIDIRRPVW